MEKLRIGTVKDIEVKRSTMEGLSLRLKSPIYHLTIYLSKDEVKELRKKLKKKKKKK